MLRKLLIVVLLFSAMAVLDTFSGLHGDPASAATMVSFGFIILAAYTLGALAERIALPHITGYLLAGVACGPHFLGLLDATVVGQLKLFDTLAIALIAMEAGSALDLGGLRQRWKQVSALSLSIIGTSLVGGMAFAILTSGMVPGLGLPFMAGAGIEQVVAVGLLLGVLIMAASPPVTMAVTSEAKARGSFTDTVLTTVIINNVQVVILFAVAVAAGHALLGSGGEGGGATAVLAQLAWSLALGAVTGAIAAAALRFLAGDALVAIVGLGFTVTWVAGEFGASPLLTFLTAGALLSSATRQGTPFKGVVSKLSGPVHVLFFTLVGADLHVDAVIQMAPFAAALVAIRLLGYFGAARLSGRLVALPDAVRRYGFLGLAPQAGMALTVALAVGHEFHGWGMDFETLGLAAIALNEMVGPILLKWSLGLAGESETARQATARARQGSAPEPAAETPAPLPRLAEWLPEPGRPDFDPWGGPPRTGERRLDDLCRELQRDLDALVRDLRVGTISRRRESGLTFVQLLRKEFLRSHRHDLVRASDATVRDDDLWTTLRLERGELAGRWKNLLLDRAASVDFHDERRTIAGLLEAVDRLSLGLPTAMTAPLRAEHLAPAEGDSRAIALRKRGTRVRVAVQRLFGGEPLRVIEPRAIARYVFVGQVPIYLRDSVGLLVLEERYLLARSRNLFEVLDQTTDEVIEAARAAPSEERPAQAGLDTTRRLELLSRLREEMEEEFRLLIDAIDRFSDESVRVTASALGRAYCEYAGQLSLSGTPALVPRDYRFTRIYEESVRSTGAIFEGLDRARQHTRGNAAALAMELDVVRLTELVRRDTEAVAADAARDIRGRVALQLRRVQDAMDEAVVAVGALLQGPTEDPTRLLEQLDLVMAPLSRTVDEVVCIAQQYRGAVRSHPPFEPLMVTLTSAADGLTDRFQVVFDPSGPTGRGIPPAPAVVDVPFRELVRAFLESETGRELSALATRQQDQVDAFAKGIEDIDRMMVFQTELARAELDARDAGPMARDSVELLDATLAGTLLRLARRAHELQQETEALADEVEAGVLKAVLGNLERLRTVLVSGQVSEIRTRLTQRTLAQGRRELVSAASRAAGLATKAVQLIRTTLGEDALQEARKIVGLPDLERARPAGPEAFAPPADRIEIPNAYRRLFSDRALEAGDMLAGREDEVARLRRVLLGQGRGASRSVAVVGVGGMGQGAVMQALVRGLGDRARIHRFDLEAPGMDEVVVDEMLGLARQARSTGRPAIISVDGFQWLFDIRPRGFDLLRRFVAGVVETSDQVGWLVAADRPVWSYADRAVPLHDAFPERMDLDLLDLPGLRRAILGRHAMSGYKLQFRRPDGNLAWWLREVMSPRARELRLYDEHCFRSLHRDSGGVLRDALRLWMASIVAIDPSSDTVWVGTSPAPPIRAIRELPADLAITLRQVARSGRITPANHAIQFQLPVEMSRALLTRLTHWGLLQREEDDTFRFHDEVAGAIYRVLRERRLVG